METIKKIALKNVVPKIFADQNLISQIWQTDISFNKGQYYLIEAESGTGKSSLCSFIYGNRNDYEGTILFNETDIRTFSNSEWAKIRRTEISILPQDLRLFPELTVYDNIQLKNRLTQYKSGHEIDEMLEALEISDKKNVPVSLLSIGQQQRVAIIRSLCQPFAFLLLDEPVSHLDERNNRNAAELIISNAKVQEAAIISTSVGNPLMIDKQCTKYSLINKA